MRLTEALLAHAASLRFEDLSPAAVAATRIFVMDSLAVGISGTGAQLPLANAVRDSAHALGQGEGARAWVTGDRLPAAGAAMLNGFLVHGQEFDCVHMPAVVHPMAVILPALVAAALTVDQPGQYQVMGFDGISCAATSDPLTIDMYVVPTLNIIADGPTTVCEGVFVGLTATEGFDSYAWSTGESGISIFAEETGTYGVTATGADGCVAISETVEVIVHDVPDVQIAAGGDTHFCLGGDVTLSASPGFASYLWSNGETGESITVTETGDYSVTATTAENCDATSNTIAVTAGTTGECAPDCFGVYGGEAITDDCGECRYGMDDPLFNTTCLDCAGVPNRHPMRNGRTGRYLEFLMHLYPHVRLSRLAGQHRG